LRELKANKKEEFKVEIAYIAKVGFFNTPNPYLLPLADFFAFNFSFSILPDILSDNTPVPFL
jgi:hypothetical protein